MSNVRQFGAQGDGQHDDTAAIRHALKEGDGELHFPPGDYRLTQSIVVPLAETGRLTIHGTGGLAKLYMDGGGPAFDIRGTHTKTADPNGFHPDIFLHQRMPTIRDLEIEGRHPEADGIRLSGVMQPTLTNVLIRKVRHGVHVTNRARNVLISHCHIYHNTGIGVFLDQVNLHQCNIIGSHISYNRLGGVRIENSEIRNLQITGNDIEYNNNRAFGLPDADAIPTAEVYIDCGATGTVREGTIASNTLQATYSPNGANIRIIGQATDERQKAGMWTISGNLIGSQATNIHLTSTRGVTIEGNYIYSGHHRNVWLEKCRSILLGSNCFGHNPDYQDKELCTGIRLVDCDRCTLTGVQIEDAQAGQHTVKDAVPIDRQGLIELIRCQTISLTGVQILEGQPFGLYAEDCSNTLITGCTMVDGRSTPRTTAAVKWVGGGAHNQIAHCRINRPIEVPEHVQLRDNLVGD